MGVIAILAGAGLAPGCGTKVQSSRLFLMDYVPVIPDTAGVPGPVPYSVQIREFKIPRTFDRTRIVYRYSPHELNYYRYYQWAVPPRVMITDLIEKHLVSSGVFETVQREFYDRRPDYEVKGTIAALEKYESGDLGGAHLAMTLELVRSSDNVTIVTHEFDREVELRNPTMTFFAQKMSEILEEEMDIFIQAINLYFHPPEEEVSVPEEEGEVPAEPPAPQGP